MFLVCASLTFRCRNCFHVAEQSEATARDRVVLPAALLSFTLTVVCVALL